MAARRTLIKGGTVVLASDTFRSDVVIEGEKIAAMGLGLGTHGTFDETIDATGKLLIPGGIDAHTHLDMPFGGTNSSDDFETGTIAAAHGGTTTIVDFAIQKKGGSLREALDTWHQKGQKAATDFGLHMIVSDVNPGSLEEMGALVRDEGVTSFKMFMAYPGVFLLDDSSIFTAMLRAGELGALTCMHAENGLPIDILVQRALAKGHTAPVYHALTRPEAAEATGTERALALGEMAETPVYIVHLSAQRALERVMEARDRGLAAYAETCPQYLFSSEDDLRGTPGKGLGEFEGAKFVCTPPLRPKHHQPHLWRGLRNYDLQVVSTDHCPFCMKGQKELGRGDFTKIPNGMPGIETRMYLLWEGVKAGMISANRFVEITSTAPAKIFSMYPRKGTIVPGADADVVVWDPDRKHILKHETLHMRVDYAPYEGRETIGYAEVVMQRGKVLVRNGKFHGKAGDGQFVKRGTWSL